MEPPVLVTSDGIVLATREWSFSGEARGQIVLVHGFASGKDDPNVVRLARELVARGLHVLAYDARGHGASGGTCTLGDLESRDVAAAVDWAQGRALPLVLVGASMGGIAVLRHAATRPGPIGLVVVSTPAEWKIPLRIRALITAALTRTGIGRWVSGRRLKVRVHPVWSGPEPPRALVPRIRGPVAIVHGYRDRMIPHRHAVDLHLDGPRSRLVLVAGMGHAFHAVGDPAICEAVDWVLGWSSDSRG